MRTRYNNTLHKKSIKAITLSLLLGACAISSCEKFTDIGDPKTQLTSVAVFESDATATSAMSNIYLDCLNNFSGGSFQSVNYIGALSADEMDYYGTSATVIQVASNQLIASNSYTTSVWNGAYNIIYQANAVIEGLSTSKGVSEQGKKQLTAEALFMRAFAQLYLTELYGDVPIIRTTEYKSNTQMPRDKQSEVYKSVIADLVAAKPALQPTFSQWTGERVRATSPAASALLAKAYLYSGDYQNAAAQAAEVIANTALFSLTTLDAAFLKNSREAIFQLRPFSTTANTNEGNLFILTARPTNSALKPSFVSSFEPGDQRRDKWVGKFTLGSESWNFPYKYKVKTSTTLSEYSTILRLSEQYLIRSEANARLHQLSQAIADLDAVRSRAGLTTPTPPNITEAELLTRILKERKFELFCEWGHRWIDLKRFGQIDQVLSPIKAGWKPSAALLPIPLNELNVNPNLTQNPGY